jgi:sec-independent protein translocase protein TatB
VFDIGFFELLVVAGVGLVVIGPEKLPGAIRTGALWIGRLKRSLMETRREIEQQIGADDIRRELRNEEIMASLKKLRDARAEIEQDIKSHVTGDVLEHKHDDHHAHDDNHNHTHHDHTHQNHDQDQDVSVELEKVADNAPPSQDNKSNSDLDETPSANTSSTKEADKPSANS